MLSYLGGDSPLISQTAIRAVGDSPTGRAVFGQRVLAAQESVCCSPGQTAETAEFAQSKRRLRPPVSRGDIPMECGDQVIGGSKYLVQEWRYIGVMLHDQGAHLSKQLMLSNQLSFGFPDHPTDEPGGQRFLELRAQLQNGCLCESSQMRNHLHILRELAGRWKQLLG